MTDVREQMRQVLLKNMPGIPDEVMEEILNNLETEGQDYEDALRKAVQDASDRSSGATRK